MLGLYSTTLILSFTKGLNQPMLTGVASRIFYFANYLMVFLNGGQVEKKETKILLEIEEVIKKRKADPEQLLFMSVILQAMLDATKPMTPKESDEAVAARETSMSWFFCSVGVTVDDFMTVCDIADLDPDYVRSFAYKVLRSKEIDFVRKRINTVLTFN